MSNLHALTALTSQPAHTLNASHRQWTQAARQRMLLVPTDDCLDCKFSSACTTGIMAANSLAVMAIAAADTAIVGAAVGTEAVTVTIPAGITSPAETTSLQETAGTMERRETGIGNWTDRVTETGIAVTTAKSTTGKTKTAGTMTKLTATETGQKVHELQAGTVTDPAAAKVPQQRQQLLLWIMLQQQLHQQQQGLFPHVLPGWAWAVVSTWTTRWHRNVCADRC